MITVTRGVLGLIAAFFMLLGLRFMFLPDSIAAEFSVSAAGVPGLSTLRADLGGSMTAIGIFVALGLRAGATRWLYAAIIALIAVVAGRLVGFAVDGPAQPSLLACTIEAAFIALLALGARRLQQTSSQIAGE
jgi:Domain of unknown function (DUF4345)